MGRDQTGPRRTPAIGRNLVQRGLRNRSLGDLDRGRRDLGDFDCRHLDYGRRDLRDCDCRDLDGGRRGVGDRDCRHLYPGRRGVEDFDCRHLDDGRWGVGDLDCRHFRSLRLVVVGLWPWAIIAFFFSMYRHPGPLDDVSPTTTRRKLIAIALLAVFVICIPLPAWFYDFLPI